ncbi:MAG: tRNA lysidine(34) synthetase TilS [Woeseia sp.]
MLSRLDELARGRDKPGRYLIGYSGGIDSAVLLHALATTVARHQTPILAIHINHGLHDDAGRWQRQCREIAADLGVEFSSLIVAIDENSGLGLEAAARQARYDAFGEFVEAGDWLLSAHHESDQAETLLLNLMRGSGIAGMAGIGVARPFAGGMLVRPLLGVSAADIRNYAEDHHLRWIDDPSNRDMRFDRNYLREQVIPVLDARWPGVSMRLARSAELAGEAGELLNDLAELDLIPVIVGDKPDRLSVGGLTSLSEQRQRNALRLAIRKCGLPPAPATRLHRVTSELIPARKDAQPLVEWPGAQIRRYRDRLYLLTAAGPDEKACRTNLPADGSWLNLGRGSGQMRLEAGVDGGIDAEAVRRGLVVRFRAGGEEFCPAGRRETHKLKKLLQEDGVVPWMRKRIPLLYSNDDLVAVGDLWVAAAASKANGYGVRWRNRPALH